MSKKKRLLHLRIDEDKLAAVEKWAADEFRSTNGQLEWIIDRMLREAGRLKKTEIKIIQKNSIWWIIWNTAALNVETANAKTGEN